MDGVARSEDKLDAMRICLQRRRGRINAQRTRTIRSNFPAPHTDEDRAMDANALKSLQAPLKERYRETPAAAVVTLKAEGRIGEGVTCSVRTGKALIEAGLHPA